MNTLRYFLLTTLFFGCSSVRGQTIVMNGQVTSVTGDYIGEFSAGNGVKLSLDFTGRLVDIFHGAFPGQAFYQINATLLIDGRNVPFAEGFPTNVPNVAVVILNRPGNEGLSGFYRWYDDGMSVGAGLATNREFRQSLLLDDSSDTLTSLIEFPSGIPMSDFVDTRGFYSRTVPYAAGNNPPQTGQIDWEITSYVGFPDTEPPVLSPVPEPSTYGLVATLCLGGLIARRRFRLRRA